MTSKHTTKFYIPAGFIDTEGNRILAGNLVKVIKMPPAKTFIGKVLNFNEYSITIYNFDAKKIVNILHIAERNLSHIVRWEIEDQI